MLPKSESAGSVHEEFSAGLNQAFVNAVLERWRGATTSQKVMSDDGDMKPEMDAPLAPAAPAAAPAGLDPNRFRLLKKSPAELYGNMQNPPPGTQK
jgi:hypothetical protein